MGRLGLAVMVGAMLVAAPALALVGAGARPGDFQVEDPDGKPVRFSSFAGRVILVLYEDRVAVEWNVALKKRLSRDKSLPRALVVLPVADMRRWRYWPARTFAQKELRRRSKEAGRPLYGDWNGEAARALDVGERTSSVMLVGEDGTVRWAAGGRLTAERMEELVALIRGVPVAGRAAKSAPAASPRDAAGSMPTRVAPVADAAAAATARAAPAVDAAAPATAEATLPADPGIPRPASVPPDAGPAR